MNKKPKVNRYLAVSVILSIGMIVESIAWIMYAVCNKMQVEGNLYVLIGILSIGYLLPIAIVTSLLSVSIDEADNKELDNDNSECR